MSHPIDELFARRLEKYEVMPSSNAWDQLQASRKNKKKPFIIWFSVAATISLMATVVFLLWNNYPAAEFKRSTTISNNDIQVPTNIENEQIPGTPEVSLPEKLATTYGETAKVIEKTAVQTVKVKTQNTPAIDPEIIATVNVEPIPVSISRKDPAFEVPKETFNEQELSTVELASTSRYSSDKELDNIFNSVANKAQKIKDEGLMAELREIKDEVFTFEFLKNKKSI